jgi:hypothetical protein
MTTTALGLSGVGWLLVWADTDDHQIHQSPPNPPINLQSTIYNLQ